MKSGNQTLSTLANAKKHWAAVLIILFVIVFQLMNMFLRLEIFPFSGFPMFSKSLVGENLVVYRVFLLDENGKRHRYNDWVYATILHSDPFLPDDPGTATFNEGELTESEEKKLEQYVATFLKFLWMAKPGIKFVKIQICSQFWKKLTRKNYKLPDRERILIERNI